MGNQTLRTLDWVDGAIEMVDQTRLPHTFETLRITTVDDLVAAIQRLSVRGAPALGVAGAYGVALAVQSHGTEGDALDAAIDAIRTARPTAVNLAKMVDRVRPLVASGFDAVFAEAETIRDEEIAASWEMGRKGADLVTELVGGPARTMTVCNTGTLATVERGTAFAVINELFDRDQLVGALPIETRPLLQGARLTAWELQRIGAPFHLLVDSAGPAVLARGGADVVLAGADRIAANGDTANKIGTFSLALGAAHASVPFIVVAPESTLDFTTKSGEDIVIEDRGAAEVCGFGTARTAPEGTEAINPAFDVTPASLITAIVTDQRVVRLDRGEMLTELEKQGNHPPLH